MRSNPYQLYTSFLHTSTSLNRVLYTVRGRWDELGIPASYAEADRLNHLTMFLSQIIAFEAFVSRCLRDECDLSPGDIKSMGSIETKLRVLLPGSARDATLSAEIREVGWALDLRNTWMHGGGDPTLTLAGERAARKSSKRAVPVDVLEATHEPKWIDGQRSLARGRAEGGTAAGTSVLPDS